MKDKADEVFQREVTKLLKSDNKLFTKLNPEDFVIRNKFLRKKLILYVKVNNINLLCAGKHPNKPSEKLIEYLEGIIERMDCLFNG